MRQVRIHSGEHVRTQDTSAILQEVGYHDGFKPMGKVLNVLTRTSNRPNRFKRCRQSILAQETDVTIRQFVSIDRPCTYAEGDVIVPATGRIAPEIPEDQAHYRDAPYNLYINDLLSAVKDGWVFVLDDDDEFLVPDAVARLEPYMDDEDNLIIFKFAMGGPKGQDYIMPKSFGRELVMNDTPCSCYIYHSKHKHSGLWHSKYCGDYFAASNLAKKLKPVWVDGILAGTQDGPSVGKDRDCKPKKWKARIIKEENKPLFLSIVIPVINQYHYTESIINQIQRTVHIPYEVIVIDNGSTDETKDLDSVTVIRNKDNLGVYKAWNQGCKKAKGSHIAILNNDLILPDGWAETLLSHEEHAICPSYTQFGDAKADFDLRNERLKEKPLNITKADMPGTHPTGFAGFCYIISREVWDRVGPFDEDFLYWYGDNDYYIRMQDMGYVPKINYNVEIHHFVRKSSDPLPDFNEQRELDRHRFFVKWPGRMPLRSREKH